MEGFTAIRNGLNEHTRLGKLTALELGVYVQIHMCANFETGIYQGCGLALACEFGEPRAEQRYKKVLQRLKKKGYINYPRGDGARGGYPILIHKYEPTIGRWLGYRLDAWKNGTSCRPEYERISGGVPEAARTVPGEGTERASNKDLRPKTQDKSSAVALETKMRMRRREALTDEEVATFEVPERLMWALERRQRMAESIKRTPELAAGYASDIRQTESVAAAIFQQSSTEQLQAMRKTHINATGRCCPPSLVDELEKRGVKVDRFVRRIEACDTGARRRRKKRRAGKRAASRRSRRGKARSRHLSSRTIQ